MILEKVSFRRSEQFITEGELFGKVLNAGVYYGHQKVVLAVVYLKCYIKQTGGSVVQ